MTPIKSPAADAGAEDAALKAGLTSRAAPAILDEARAIASVEHVPFEVSKSPSPDSHEDSLGIASVLAGEKRRDVLVRRAFMEETYGGGSLEAVPGYDSVSALTTGVTSPGSVRWPQLQPRPLPVKASLDAITPESVIGEDTRRPVPSTVSLPWRCIALLKIRYRSGRTGQGTGWFIGPRTLVTAAHCVHHPIAKAASQIVVTPGFHRGAAPFGQYEVVDSLWNPAWKDSFDPVLDFALIYINENPGVGWFGYAAAAEPNLRRVLVNIAGYPEDRPQTQWYDGARIADVDRNFIYHNIDTEQGESGAPLFWSDRSQRIGLGIHTYSQGDGLPTNLARRITPELYQLFEQNTL